MNVNTTDEAKASTSLAGLRFNDKVEVYEFFKRNIKQQILITGSTALLAYGLTDKSDPYDLDLIIHKPTDETESFLAAIHSLFAENEHERTYMRPDRSDFDIGKLTMFRFLGSKEDFKVHIFYKSKAQQFVSYEHKGTIFPLALPGDIFLAKRRFSRSKDYMQLAAICSKILTGPDVPDTFDTRK